MTEHPLKILHQEFMAYARFARQVSPNTLRGYQNAFDLLLKRYPDLTTAMISPELLTGFFEWLQTRERIVGRGALPRRKEDHHRDLLDKTDSIFQLAGTQGTPRLQSING